MCSGQCSGEIDAAAGDLRAGGVRMSERRGHCDRSSTESSHGGNDRCLRVCATVDGDRLAIAKANGIGDRNYGGARVSGGANSGRACRANSCDHGVLKICACVNRDLLSNVKTLHAGNFDVRRSGVFGSGESGSGLREEVVAVAVAIRAIWKAARALIDRARNRRKAARRTRRRYVAATLIKTGTALVALRGPWVEQTSIVEAVDKQASAVSEHNAALSERDCPAEEWNVACELGTSEPLIRCRRALVAGSGDYGVTHN